MDKMCKDKMKIKFEIIEKYANAKPTKQDVHITDLVTDLHSYKL